MKKLFIKSGVMLMLALTMVSCKKDITEELEASNESSNKGALLPPNAISIRLLLMMELAEL